MSGKGMTPRKGYNPKAYRANYNAVFRAKSKPRPVKKLPVPLTLCRAAKDGECFHALCPQIRDNEPHATGRHCPIDRYDDEC